MTIDGQKTLQVGQVLEGLLEVANGAGGTATGGARGTVTLGGMTLWERMLAAVELKFDADNDGDVRGKG